MSKNLSRWNNDEYSFFAPLSPFGFYFDKFLRDIGDMPTRVSKDFKSDVQETDTQYIVEAEIPGFSKEDIKIELSDNMLTISAENKKEVEDKQGSYVKKEISRSSVSRSYALADVAEAGECKANYENGILKVIVPKEVKEVPKKEIKID